MMISYIAQNITEMKFFSTIALGSKLDAPKLEKKNREKLRSEEKRRRAVDHKNKAEPRFL